jgi:hypothetical protein
MSKSNCTAASMAHKPEEAVKGEQAHAHSYPGRKPAKGEKVVDAQHSPKALAAGRASLMGVSANGSHKSIPSSKDEVGQV